MAEKGERSERNCIVCYRDSRYFSCGSCDHPVCFECSARMKCLLEQSECPICRKVLDYVVFTRGKKSYNNISHKLPMYIFLPKYGIYIESEEIKNTFEELLSFRCVFCEEKPTFGDFDELRMHVQRVHDRFYCDLCVDNIKHFPKERRSYNREDLALHKRKGDRNDKSQKGHPLCKFCDTRFFDDDELYKHLRKDHYFCHFCDCDGFNHFYNAYDDLRKHFRCEHYLCEEEHCKDEKFTSVFRSEIDLKAHLASTHSRLLGKHGMKQTRALDLDFAAPSRIEEQRLRRYQNQRRDNRYRDVREDEKEEEEVAVQAPRPQPQPELSSAMDFPSLDGSIQPPKFAIVSGNTPLPSSNSIAQKVALSSGKNVTGPGARIVSQTNSSGKVVSSGGANGAARPSWNVKVTGSNKLDEEFPALMGSSGNTYSGSTVNSFTSKISTVQAPLPTQRQSFHPPNSMANLGDAAEFPSLSGKKKSSGVGGGGEGGGIWSDKFKNTQKKGQSKKVAPCPDLSEPPGSSSSSMNYDDSFTFVPLSASRKKKDANNVKFFANDEVETIPPQEETTKKKKKNKNKEDNKTSVSIAADALFNSGKNKTTTSSNSNNQRKAEYSGNDFPSLEPLKSCISSTSASAPPPGFGAGPPPGFSNNKTEVNNLNGVNVSNATSVYSMALRTEVEDLDFYMKKLSEKSKISNYIQPPEFTKRNENLFEAIQVSLDREASSCDLFRVFSNKYRKHEASPEEYYKIIQDILGPRDFRTILPELLCLLPDIKRQHELLHFHRKERGGQMFSLSICEECFQLLRPGDLPLHKKAHSAEEFPSL